MRSSTINLNIHSLHAIASLNMRDYDVPLQDSFLLTDWVTGADRWFEPEREMVFYRSLEDLHGRIDEFLSHPPEKRTDCGSRETTCPGGSHLRPAPG